MNSATKFVSPRAAGAHYFRPAQFVDAFALALQPREAMPTGDGKSEMLCSAVIFDTEDALYDGRPTRVIQDIVVNAGIIYRQLVRAHDQGGVLAGYVGQGDETTYGTRPWLIKDLDPETHGLVVKAYEALAVSV